MLRRAPPSLIIRDMAPMLANHIKLDASSVKELKRINSEINEKGLDATLIEQS